MALSTLLPGCAFLVFQGQLTFALKSRLQSDAALNKARVKIMCVSRIWRILYNIPGIILSELDEGGPAGFQQSDMLHYGYYSVARPKGAGEEGFIMFQGSGAAFFLCEEDKACLRSQHPAPSLPSSPPLSRLWKRCPSYRTDKWTSRWTRRSIRVNVTVQRLSCTMLTRIKQNPRLLFFLPQYRSWKNGLKEDGTMQFAFPDFSHKRVRARAV